MSLHRASIGGIKVIESISATSEFNLLIISKCMTIASFTLLSIVTQYLDVITYMESRLDMDCGLYYTSRPGRRYNDPHWMYSNVPLFYSDWVVEKGLTLLKI